MFKSIGRLASRVGVKMKKNAPELWLGAGMLLIFADVVVAVRAGTKVKEKVQPHYEVINAKKEEVLEIEPENKTEIAAVKKEINNEQMKLFGDMSLLFAPVIVLNAAGCFCFFRCYKTLKTWNAGLVVAYNALLDAYTAYRTNNIARNGLDADKQALTGGEIMEYWNPEDPDGEALKTLKVPVESRADFYGRIFDVDSSTMFNPNWLRNPQYVLDFLKLAQMTAEEKRQTQGFVTFADVLLSLGMKAAAYTYVHGWDKTPVSFGLEDYPEEVLKDFKLGKYPALRLDFNCDGLIIYAINKECSADKVVL